MLLSLAGLQWAWSQNSNTWIALWLASLRNADGTKRFDVAALNSIPIGGYVLSILSMFFFAWASDKTGRRLTFFNVQMSILLVGLIGLTAWPAAFEAKMFFFFLLWMSNSAGPILVVSSRLL